MAELYENGYLVDLTEHYNDGTLAQLTRVFPVEETWNYVYTNMAKGGSIYGIPTVLNATETEAPKVWDAAGLEIEGYDPRIFATYISAPTSVSGQSSDGPTIREDLLQAVRPDSLTMAEIEELYAENGTFTEEQIYHVDLKSADDFWDLLRDIKKELDANPGKYLDANGNPVEIMAGIHTEEDNWRYSVNLMGALYNAPANTNYFALMNYEPESADTVLEWGWSSELYQDHWKNMNDMVQEGIISANSFVDNKAAFQEKMNAAHYVVHYGGNYYTDYTDANGDYTYRYVPVWVNSDFNTMKQGGTSSVSYAYMFGLFKKAFKSDEQIEQFLHAINYLNSDVGVNNFVWGPKSAGLFTEDENGVRSYATEALFNDMIGHSGTGESTKYGLYDIYGGENLGDVWFPKGIAMGYLSDDYAYAGRLEAKASDARKFFVPGILEGKSMGENNINTLNAPNVHQFGLNYEWGKTFWAARTGFENQIKKMIVAKDDAEYQKELDILNEYCATNGLTDDALANFNKEWVNANSEFLKAAGIID